VIIGKPIYAVELYDEKEDYKTNLDRITKELRSRIIRLGNSLEEKIENERKKENK
jgi:hypothetical protein